MVQYFTKKDAAAAAAAAAAAISGNADTSSGKTYDEKAAADAVTFKFPGRCRPPPLSFCTDSALGDIHKAVEESLAAAQTGTCVIKSVQSVSLIEQDSGCGNTASTVETMELAATIAVATVAGWSLTRDPIDRQDHPKVRN
jgi:hypothetical protein